MIPYLYYPSGQIHKLPAIRSIPTSIGRRTYHIHGTLHRLTINTHTEPSYALCTFISTNLKRYSTPQKCNMVMVQTAQPSPAQPSRPSTKTASCPILPHPCCEVRNI